MPSFETPAPILFGFSAQCCDLEVTASERSDTVVTVRPRNAAKRGDVALAEQTTVEHTGDRITLSSPKRFSVFGTTDAITVTVELPAGSHLEGDLSYGGVRGRGRLGDLRVATAYGELAFDDTGAAELRTGSGDIAVNEIRGDARLTTGNGTVRVDLVDGSAVVKSSNGQLVIGEISGTLEATSANGDIEVQFPGTSTSVKTAYGKVRVGDAPEGELRLQTSYGDVVIGVPVGTSAWIDASSGYGLVRSELSVDDAPDDAARTLEVRARTKYGDIVIRRPLERRPGDRREARTIARKGSDS